MSEYTHLKSSFYTSEKESSGLSSVIYHFLQNRNFPEQMYLFSNHKCLVSLEMESLSVLRVALSLVKDIMIRFFAGVISLTFLCHYILFLEKQLTCKVS